MRAAWVRLSAALMTLGALAAPAARAQLAFTPLDVPGATFTAAYGISNTGLVAGQYDAAGAVHGYVYAGGRYTTLDVPGATCTRAFGVNSAGQIVGEYRDAAGASGYLSSVAAVTAPEPATTALLGAGLGGLAAVARGRRRATG